MLSSGIKDTYIEILRKELVLATGCTEPIALAYAAARMREILGCFPDRVEAVVSGNIIKNVKSVIVPNTGGLKGIPAAIAAGIVAGDAGRVLQVIASVSKEKQVRALCTVCSHALFQRAFCAPHASLCRWARWAACSFKARSCSSCSRVTACSDIAAGNGCSCAPHTGQGLPGCKVCASTPA